MYIYKGRRCDSGRFQYVTAEKLRVTEVEKVRVTGRSIAGFTEVTGTGQSRSDVIRVQSAAVNPDALPHKRVNGVRGDGQKGSFNDYLTRTAAGVKAKLRRVRPEELERIAAIDVKIATAEEALKQLRLKRWGIVAEAWTKAHVVTLKEIEEQSTGGRY